MDLILRRNIYPVLLITALAAGLLCLFDYFAPPEPASVTAWAGITIGLVAAASLIWPFRFLLIRSRKVAALVLLSGALITATGLLWPARRVHTAQRSSRLDDFLPEYDFSERHAVNVHATPEQTAAALRQVTFDDIKVFDALMRIRAAAGGHFRTGPSPGQRRVLDALSNPGSGFFPLHDDGREIVMCMAGRPWKSEPKPRMRAANDFAVFNAPGSVKIAFNLLVQEGDPGWSRVVTETRVRATDDAARSIMARYWRLICPGTGMIRRMWLNAMRDRAEQGTS